MCTFNPSPFTRCIVGLVGCLLVAKPVINIADEIDPLLTRGDIPAIIYVLLPLWWGVMRLAIGSKIDWANDSAAMSSIDFMIEDAVEPLNLSPHLDSDDWSCTTIQPMNYSRLTSVELSCMTIQPMNYSRITSVDLLPSVDLSCMTKNPYSAVDADSN